jgi:hypothetical protein
MSSDSRDTVQKEALARLVNPDEPELDMATSIHVRGLLSLSHDHLNSLAGEAKEVLEKRQSAIASEHARPYLSAKSKVLSLPSYIFDEDNHIGHMVAGIWDKLGKSWQIFKIESKLKMNKTSKDEESFLIGLSCGPYTESYLSMTKSSDEVENGRKFFRAQQILHHYGKSILTVEALKKNHRFFKNNPEETVLLGRKQTPIESYKDMLASFIPEADSEQVTDVLLSFIKQLPLPEGVATRSIRDNLIPVSEFITREFSRTIVLGDSQTKKSRLKKDKVPGIPRQSPLFLKGEQEAILQHYAYLYETPEFLKNQEKFWEFLNRHGYQKMKTTAADIYNARADFLSKFASVTNKRLIALKELSRNRKLRKKEVSQEMVYDLLYARKDPYAYLASEILSISSDVSRFKERLAKGAKLERAEMNPGALSIIMDRALRQMTCVPPVYSDVYEHYHAQTRRSEAPSETDKSVPKKSEAAVPGGGKSSAKKN